MVDATLADLGGLLGSSGAQPSQGALWDSLTGRGQWLAPQSAPADASALPTSEASAQPHGLLGHIASGLHGIIGGLLGSQGVQTAGDTQQSAPATAQPQTDPMSAFVKSLQPSAWQVTQEAMGSGETRSKARQDLIQRNLQMAMMPNTIRRQLLMNAAINRELAGAEGGGADGGVLQNAGAPSPANNAPSAAPGLQTASVTTAAPSGAPRAPQSGPMFSRRMYELMAMEGDPNAKTAYEIGAPKIAITRDGVIYDENDPSGRILGMAPHPQYINDQRVDVNSPDAPRFIGKAPVAGAEPIYDQNSKQAGWRMSDGSIQAIQQSAAASEGGKQSAAAPYDTVVVQTPQGPVTMSKAQLAAMQGGAPNPQGSPAPASAPIAPAAAPQPAQGAPRTITAQRAMQFYVDRGFKPEQAAGIVGNLIGESGLDASRTADDGSFGLAQWTGPRLQGLFAFAKRNKLDPSDPNTQLEYSAFELGNGEKAAGDAIRSAGNVNDATTAAVGYERPAGYTPQNPQAASGYGRRLTEAQQLLAGNGGGEGAQPPAAPKGIIAQGVSPDVQKADQEAISDLRKDVQARRLLASRANEFVSKMGDFATGPAYGGMHIPMTHSEFAPIRDVMSLLPGSGNKIDELDAISNSTWQDLRQQGSGGIRGFEAGGWKQAFPNIENYGPANVEIAKRLTAEQRQKEAELAFKEGWLQKYGSLSANGGADAAWSKMPIASNALAGQEEPQPKASPSRGPKLPGRAPAPPSAQTAVGIDPRAVADLKRDHSPQAQAEFDQVFGKGAAKRVLGGV